jgi:hypothetical protein
METQTIINAINALSCTLDTLKRIGDFDSIKIITNKIITLSNKLTNQLDN